VAHHFIFALEAFSAEGARTPVYGTEVWAVLGVDVCVGAGGVRIFFVLFLILFCLLEEILCLEWRSCAAWMGALVATYWTAVWGE